jgi:Replication-relaxation
MTTMTKHRHFSVGTEETPYEQQQRDLSIGLWLAKRRFLDADQIGRLVANEAGGSHRGTKMRLTKMFRNGLLVKPSGQKEYWDECGRRDHVYGNSTRMGRKLQKKDLVPEGRLDWTQRNKTAKRDFVEHAVETSELMVTFETTARQYEGLQVREVDELQRDLPERTQTIERPWFFEGVPQGLPAKARKRAYPDAVLSVRQEKGGKSVEQFFVAEIDCTSMPVVRGEKLERALKAALLDQREAKGKAAQSAAKLKVDQARFKLLQHNLTINQTAFLQKFAAYFWAFKNDWHKQHFGWPAVRVLVTTRNESHRNRMLEGLQYVTGGQAPNLFLFSTFDAIRTCDDIFQHEWLNGAGETVTLA